MKKVISLIISVAVVLSFCGCEGKGGGESTSQSELNVTESISSKALNENRYLPELQALNGKALEASVRISKNEIALVYVDYDDTKSIETEMPVKFAIYNTEVGAVVAQSEEYMFNFFEFSDIEAYGSGFYLHNNDSVFVFNKQCELLKKLKLPIENPAVYNREPYTLSKDGEKCIYENERKWYISNTDGTAKTEIFENHPEIRASEVFFTSEPNILAYIGRKLPASEGEGKDCYGYCNIETAECTYILADNIYAEALGDNMIIQQHAVDNGKIRSSAVTVYNPITGKTNEIKMKYDDREEYFLWSDSPEYIISIHSVEGEHRVNFNIYKEYEFVKTVEYDYPENDYIDRNADIYFNSKSGEIIVSYYSNEFSGDVFLKLYV